MKLNKTETQAFETIGAAICNAKASAKDKKSTMPLLASVLAENRAEFLEGVTIGSYKFTLVQRDELTAIRV